MFIFYNFRNWKKYYSSSSLASITWLKILLVFRVILIEHVGQLGWWKIFIKYILWNLLNFIVVFFYYNNIKY